MIFDILNTVLSYINGCRWTNKLCSYRIWNQIWKRTYRSYGGHSNPSRVQYTVATVRLPVRDTGAVYKRALGGSQTCNIRLRKISQASPVLPLCDYISLDRWLGVLFITVHSQRQRYYRTAWKIALTRIRYRSYTHNTLYRSCLLTDGIAIFFISWWFERRRHHFCCYQIQPYSSYQPLPLMPIFANDNEPIFTVLPCLWTFCWWRPFSILKMVEHFSSPVDVRLCCLPPPPPPPGAIKTVSPPGMHSTWSSFRRWLVFSLFLLIDSATRIPSTSIYCEIRWRDWYPTTTSYGMGMTTAPTSSGPVPRIPV